MAVGWRRARSAIDECFIVDEDNVVPSLFVCFVMLWTLLGTA